SAGARGRPASAVYPAGAGPRRLPPERAGAHRPRRGHRGRDLGGRRAVRGASRRGARSRMSRRPGLARTVTVLLGSALLAVTTSAPGLARVPTRTIPVEPGDGYARILVGCLAGLARDPS